MRVALSVLSALAVGALSTVASAQSRPIVAAVASPEQQPTSSPQTVMEPVPGPAPVPAPAPAEWRPAPDRWTHAAGYRLLVLTVSPAGAGCRGGATFVSLRYVIDKGFNPHVYGAAIAADGGIVCSGGIWYHGAGPLKGKVGGTLPDLLIKGGTYFYKRG